MQRLKRPRAPTFAAYLGVILFYAVQHGKEAKRREASPLMRRDIAHQKDRARVRYPNLRNIVLLFLP